MFDKTFIRFIIVGIINTFIGYCIIIILFHSIGLSYTSAYFLSYIIGLVISYFLTRNFVFFSQVNKDKEFIKFLISFAIAYGLSYLGLYILMENNLFSSHISFLLSMVTYSILFYLLNKYITFKVMLK